MSSFFSSFARSSSLARPPSFNDFGGSAMDEPRASMDSSSSEAWPSPVGRGSLDSRGGLFHSASLPSSGLMYNPSYARRGASLDLPSSPSASSPGAVSAAAHAAAAGSSGRPPLPPLRSAPGGNRTLLHTASMPPPSPSARAAAAAAAAAAASGAPGMVSSSLPRTAPPPSSHHHRHKIQGIDAFEFADIVRSL